MPMVDAASAKAHRRSPDSPELIPSSTREAVIHGQKVTVKVYAAKTAEDTAGMRANPTRNGEAAIASEAFSFFLDTLPDGVIPTPTDDKMPVFRKAAANAKKESKNED